MTTAYQEHASKAFDLKATDYLLKPFTFERFVQAVDRVKTFLDRAEPAGNGSRFSSRPSLNSKRSS